MTGLYFLLGVSIGMWIVLGKVVFSEINKTYDRGEIFTNQLLYSWYAMWAFHHATVVLAAWFSIWWIPVNKNAALLVGVTMFALGAIVVP